MAIGPVETGRVVRAPVRAGVAVCVLTLAAATLWALGFDAVAGVLAIVAFAVGGAVAGADSRRAGDWTSAPRR